MKKRKDLQTSLRAYRCQLCGKWVLFTENEGHNKSNCKAFYLGPKPTNLTLKDLKKNFKYQENRALSFYNNQDISDSSPLIIF